MERNVTIWLLSCTHLGRFILYEVLQVLKDSPSFSWNLSFVDIDPASNFTHCESQPGPLFDFMIPAGCLVIMW